MQFFKDYTLGYLRSADDKRVVDIIQKRYGLEGETKHTLKELGSIYNLSRERIRQIESAHLHKLKELMRERERFNKINSSILDILSENKIIPQERLDILFSKQQELIQWKLFYLELLGVYYFEKIKIYHTKDIKRNSLINTIRTIRLSLKKYTIPMNREVLFEKVNFIGLNASELDVLVNSTGAIRKIVNGESFYQLPVDHEWSAGRLAHLILWENGKVMTTNEILEEMNGRIRIDKRICNLVNQMGTTEAIQNIDLHTWGLREWGLESNYVKHIMEDVLRENDRPMAISKLIDGIRERRTGVLAQSISVYSRSEPFQRLGDGKIILTDWVDKLEMLGG